MPPRTLTAVLVVAMFVAVAPAASAHTLSYSAARTESLLALKAHHEANEDMVSSTALLAECRRLAQHVIRCSGAVHGMNEAVGRNRLCVGVATVRFRFHSSRTPTSVVTGARCVNV